MVQKKEFIFGIFILGIFLLSVHVASAYQLLCLTYGQSVPSEQDPRYTCFHDHCQICVTDTLFPANINACKDIPSCSTLGNGTGLDTEPPVLTMSSPTEGQIFDSRKVIFDIMSNEPASLYYIDNVAGRGKWKRLSGLTRQYRRELSFKDGFLNLTIKGVDRNKNEGLIVRTFYVDSKDPRIRSTMPKKGFANGEFDVNFIEDNPIELLFTYGNNESGMHTLPIPIDSCELVKKEYHCNTTVSLTEYDQETITYQFMIRDIANNTGISKPAGLIVDTTAPIILNPSDFWMQHEKHIMFNISIDEMNFNEVSYIDHNDSRPKERTICSNLKNDFCIKKVTFKTGHHELTVYVKDDAGNFISEMIMFDVV